MMLIMMIMREKRRFCPHLLFLSMRMLERDHLRLLILNKKRMRREPCKWTSRGTLCSV